jgi:hypothetical protein
MLYHHQTAGQNHNIETVNRSFESVARLNNLGKAPIDRNYIHEEIERMLNSGNACNH